MALLELNYQSYCLGMDIELMVQLPTKRNIMPEAQPDKKYPVLYLLHGHSQDHTGWVRRSDVELLTRDRDLIVVMVNGHRSFYTNAKHGFAYEDFLVKELPIVIGNLFPASTKPEDTYIAGLSMGGYGALKLALKHPDVYGHVASMSGAVDIEAMLEKKKPEDTNDFLINIFGTAEEFHDSEDDLFHLAASLDPSKQPQMYICCGTEDFLYPAHRKFREFLEKETSLQVTFDERPGEHLWSFWNEEVPLILKFFNLIP